MNNLRLTVPEPEIRLYEQGFEGVCKLGRAEDGRKLSDLVERIAEPMVIALDAPWGAGKSVFLKCWVGAHGSENEGAATTVYFDAFKHDYLDDPLVSIVGALDERVTMLKPEDPTKSALRSGVDKAKRYAPAIGRGLLRVGAASLTGGLTNQIENPAETILDEAIKASGSELGALTKDFWKAEENRRTAMEAFRRSLQSIATPKKKLVIVVDELDRCRPDYALNLLEVIKHFFDVPNVHFVLGVNLRELGNSVRARYGAGVNAEKYLQKFVTVVMPLTLSRPRSEGNTLQLNYFQSVCDEIGYGSGGEFWMNKYIQLVDQHASLSLREVERIATLNLVAPQAPVDNKGQFHFRSGAIVMSVAKPELIRKIRDRSLTFEDVESVFRISSRGGKVGFAKEAHNCWQLATQSSPPLYTDETKGKYFREAEPQEVLRDIVAHCLDSFRI